MNDERDYGTRATRSEDDRLPGAGGDRLADDAVGDAQVSVSGGSGMAGDAGDAGRAIPHFPQR